MIRARTETILNYFFVKRLRLALKSRPAPGPAEHEGDAS